MYSPKPNLRLVGSTLLVACTLTGCTTLGDKRSAAELRVLESVSFDDFISQSPGIELSGPVVAPGYRAKRLAHSMLQPIQFQGFFFKFANDFEAWCKANHGTYARTEATDADCFDGASRSRWLGAYQIEVQTQSSYGNTVGGSATYRFFRDAEMHLVADRIAMESVNKQIARARQTKCRSEWIAKAQTEPHIGTLTLQGMIIDSRLPLVQVQNLNSNPPQQWIKVSQLQPPYVDDYCRLPPP